MPSTPPINNHIIENYTREFTALQIKPIGVYSIHNHDDICFNSSHREILYSLQDCFTEHQNWIDGHYNIKKNHRMGQNSYFKESTYGKALVISILHIPESPPLGPFWTYYQKHFKDRLTLLDNAFKKKSDFSYKQLFYEKSMGLQDTTVTHLPGLPEDVTKHIMTFIIYQKLEDCLEIRDKYEQLRQKINLY